MQSVSSPINALLEGFYQDNITIDMLTKKGDFGKTDLEFLKMVIAQEEKFGDLPIDSRIILSHLRHELSRLAAEKGPFMSVHGKI